MVQRVRIEGDLFHQRVPDGAVKATRPGRWGNPHPVGKACKVCAGAVHDLDEALQLFRVHLVEHPELVARARRELAGRDLACWCDLDKACHADVWLALVSVEGETHEHTG
jgi:hypothetical protein